MNDAIRRFLVIACLIMSPCITRAEILIEATHAMAASEYTKSMYFRGGDKIKIINTKDSNDIAHIDLSFRDYRNSDRHINIRINYADSNYSIPPGDWVLFHASIFFPRGARSRDFASVAIMRNEAFVDGITFRVPFLGSYCAVFIPNSLDISWNVGTNLKRVYEIYTTPTMNSTKNLRVKYSLLNYNRDNPYADVSFKENVYQDYIYAGPNLPPFPPKLWVTFKTPGVINTNILAEVYCD